MRGDGGISMPSEQMGKNFHRKSSEMTKRDSSDARGEQRRNQRPNLRRCISAHAG